MFKKQLFLIMFITLIFVTSGGCLYSKEYTPPAQMDTNVTYIIQTNDNEVNIGRYFDQDSITIRLITEKRLLITLLKKDILTIEIFDKSKSARISVDFDTKNWFENPNASRYFFSSSAINIKSGQAYYKNTYLFLNSFTLGITSNLSLTGGFELLSTIASIENRNSYPIFFVSPNLGFKVTDNLHFGVGYLYTNFINTIANNKVGCIYGVTTIGNLNSNLSFTLGFEHSGFNFNEVPVIGFSGTIRVSKGFSLISDNLLLPMYYKTSKNNYEIGYYPVFSYGIRIFGEHIAFDLALINNAEISKTSLFGFPFIDFVANF